jgi:hypothetical protein
VLRAHGRPLPERTEPERPGPERPGPERRGAGDGARPGALLIRATLDPSRGYPAADQAGPSAGLVPHPGGWRAGPPYARLTQAMIADPAGALPHYPMVSHRGGYPDGS